MSNYRSNELKPVPEYDRLSNAALTAMPAQRGAGRAPGRSGGGAAAGPGNASFDDAATSSGGGGFTGGGGGPGFGGGGGGGGGGLGKMSVRMQRLSSIRHAGNLARSSLIIRGKQLIDMGKLQANWLRDTLVTEPEMQDYVNEEDQGFVALLARHVDVPASAWQKLQEALGVTDGQFWHTGLATGADFRMSQRASVHSMKQMHKAPRGGEEGEEGDGAEAAETGKAKEPWKRKPCRSIFGLPVIKPYNLFAVLWTMAILLLDLTYTAFWVPMNVAFCTAQYGNLSSGCTTSDLVGGALYFLNVLLGFQIGVVATNGFRKRTVVEGRQVAWIYVRYGRFLLDLLACLPFVYLVVVLGGESAGSFSLNKGWVNCLSLLRLLRMLRLVTISKVVYVDSLSGRFQDSALGRMLSVTFLTSLFLAYQLAVAINLFACIMVLCAYFEGYSNSWMTAVDWAHLPSASQAYQWYCAVYWMIVTATTTGFGDFAPRSLAEQVVANVVMVGGMIMFGVLVASIGNALSRATAEAFQAYASRQKILHVVEWTEHRLLPLEIRKQVQNFYADKYGRKEEESLDATIMSALPSRLRARVAKAMCVPLLAGVPPLEDLSDDVLGLLAESMSPLRLPAGEDLCQQGDVASCFWLLAEGTVQAVRYKEGSVTIDASDMSRLLGESVLLGDAVESCRVRPWTLRTVTPCRLWGIALPELYPLMRMHPEIGEKAADWVKHEVLRLHLEAHKQQQLREPQHQHLRGSQQQQLQHHHGLQRQHSAGGPAMDAGAGAEEAPWCEMAAVVARQLHELPSEEAGELMLELSRTFAYDGTLQPLLEQIIAFCAAYRGQEAAAGASPTEPPVLPSVRQARAASPGPPGVGAGLGPGGGVSGLSGGGSAPPGFNTAFGSAAAAASLSAALQTVASVDLEAAAEGPGGMAAQVYGGGGPMSMAPGVQLLFPAGGSGGGAAAVQCPGCQRCVCPSCGQGMDPLPAIMPVGATGLPSGASPAAAAAAAVAASATAALLQAGVNAKPTAGPALRSWVNRATTLRRTSIGVRQDQVWATERKSFDRRLAAVSVAPFE